MKAVVNMRKFAKFSPEVMERALRMIF